LAETTLRPHHQGYAEYAMPMRFSTLQSRFPGLHLETRKGTQKQAIKYCKKDGHVTEEGEPKQQGKRNDITDVCELIDNNVPLHEIAKSNPSVFVKHAKGFHAYRYATHEHRTARPYVEWRYGLTGVGKTRGAIDKHRLSYFIKDGTAWWDGYEQEEAIIIDDFDGKWPFRDLLRLLDWNPYQGQTKGGYIKVNSPYIYITCEHPPDEFYYGNALNQVLRRLDKVVHVTPTPTVAVTDVTEVAGNTIQPLPLRRMGAFIDLTKAYDNLPCEGFAVPSACGAASYPNPNPNAEHEPSGPEPAPGRPGRPAFN